MGLDYAAMISAKDGVIFWMKQYLVLQVSSPSNKSYSGRVIIIIIHR